jgi:hypothetical protein
MKKTGLAILVIGILMTLFTGFQFVTREKVVDIGDIHITRGKNHSIPWSPFIGIAVMIVGGGIMLVGSKK